jgi:5-methylcytosine-specific restriction endonuclease McrA
MSKLAAAFAKSKEPPQAEHEEKPQWNAQERLALRKIRREAKAAGATLKSDGEGGLRPSLVLGIMRRDHFRCTNEHCPDPKKDLTVDHISGHPKEIAADPEARKRKDLKRGIKLGHVNKLEALRTSCAVCHDAVHDRERQIDKGKKPTPMPGTE